MCFGFGICRKFYVVNVHFESEVQFVKLYMLAFGIMKLKPFCLLLCLTEIDMEGVIAADTDPAQDMGDESVEVFYSNVLTYL